MTSRELKNTCANTLECVPTTRETTTEKISKLDASLLVMHWYHQAQNDDTLILALEGSQSMFRSPKSCHAKLILYGNRDRSACH